MAKIKVMGDTLQIVSSIPYAMIKKAKRYNPDALQLKTVDGEPVFAIDLGTAHWSKNGIVFSSIDYSGYAFMTTNNPVSGDHTNSKEEEKNIILSFFAEVITNLEKVEAQIIECFHAIEAMEEYAANAIEFADVEEVINVGICDAEEPEREDRE